MNNRMQWAQLIVLCVIALALCVIALAVTPAPSNAPMQPSAGLPKAVPTATGATSYTDMNLTGQLDVAGATTFGGGYGSTGCSISAAGVLQCDGAVTFASTLAVTGASTFTGAATFSANPILPSESITPTHGGTITPTKVLVTLTPAGALGTALGACTTGQHAIIYNSVNANVVISDTGNFIGAGDQTLGQYDALAVVCIGSKWVQVSAASAN
jgi:hypothetical protein